LTQALAPNPKEVPSGQWTRSYPVRLGVSKVDQYMINSVIERIWKKKIPTSGTPSPSPSQDLVFG
jgi:hypothetical protein